MCVCVGWGGGGVILRRKRKGQIGQTRWGGGGGGWGGGGGSDLGVDISHIRGESIKLSPHQLKKPEI